MSARPLSACPQVWRRADTIVRLNFEEHLGYFPMDQALLNDAINSAAANLSTYSWPSLYDPTRLSHPFWRDHDRGNKSYRAPGTWYEAEFTREPVKEEWIDAAARACGETCATPNFAAHREWLLKNYAVKHMEISVPLDAPERALPGGDAVETFSAAPPWTFGHQEDEYRHFELSAVTHLVGCDLGFRAHGGSHAGRRALMAAAGAWMAAPSDAKYATLAPQLVTRESLATRRALGELIQRFVAAAHELGRVPALFGFECLEAPWVGRLEGARLGVYDLHIVKHGDKCYPGVGGAKCNHRLFVYDFEIEHHGLPFRTVNGWRDAAEHPEAPVMHLRHLPEAFDPAKIKQGFREACPDYFSRLEDDGDVGRR